MPAPPCQCCEPRQPYVVDPALQAAGRGSSGVVNASLVTAVGAGADVATAILDGDPFEGSDYDGRWQDIQVIAAYPISKFVPGTEDPPTDDEWVFDRWEYDTWERGHIGPAVVHRAEGASFTDSDNLWDRDSLAGDESVRVPDAHDPGDYYFLISRTVSEITLAIPVVTADLLSWASDDENLSEWGAWTEAESIASGFFAFGISAGTILLDGGYGADDMPSRVDRIVGAYAVAGLIDDNDGLPPMMMRDPGPILRAGVTIIGYDHKAGGPLPEDGTVVTRNMPWQEPFGWSTAADLSTPTGLGWFGFGGGDAGDVEIIEFTSWSLDVAPMFYLYP